MTDQTEDPNDPTVRVRNAIRRCFDELVAIGAEPDSAGAIMFVQGGIRIASQAKRREMVEFAKTLLHDDDEEDDDLAEPAAVVH